MKKKLLFWSLSIFCLIQFKMVAQETILTVFDKVVFYDGYAAVVNQPVAEGVIRHRNDLYAKKLSTTELQSFGNLLTLNVTIKAACDNYDRIGSINLAFVPKNATSYVPSEVQRIELGRFITPFMNKNKTPDEVFYAFDMDNMTKIFKDPTLNATYDFWVEFEVFGVPYSAQTQVTGCTGRTDVFFGTLEFISNDTSFTSENNLLLPLNFKKDLNNYAEGASDAIGQSVRTITFDLPSAMTDANFYLITSNHGANAGGEEYNRRNHYVYLDGNLKLTYKPGEISCEPYRQYNTQSNGIYGNTPRTNAQWQSFSNWCPGAIIPIRVIPVGNLNAGQHTFKISIPDAVFKDAQGNIPVSLYLQGTTSSLGFDNLNDKINYNIYPNPTKDTIQINSLEEVKKIKVFNLLGQQIFEENQRIINFSKVNQGIYIITIEFENGKTISEKVIKN